MENTNAINDRATARREAFAHMSADVLMRNGAKDDNDMILSCMHLSCMCLRRYTASMCGACQHPSCNSACVNVLCDSYFNPEIVKCDRCDKWMLSVYNVK